MDIIFKKLNNPSTSLLSRVGLPFIKTYCLNEIDSTIGRNNISFNMFISNLEHYKQQPRMIKVIKYIKAYYKINELKDNHYKWIYSLYFSSISIFKPIIAVSIYKKYNPTSILDPCAGWGGRMIGANALNIKYTGIDTNTNLIEPYNQMIKHLNGQIINMIWKDCLSVDYSTIDYDLVLTSPPYFNIEAYNNMPCRSKLEWIEWYKTFALKTFQYLKTGGYYVICMNDIMYEIFKSVLGECSEKTKLIKQIRPNQTLKPSKNTEYVFVWNKV
jgi:hypothetical protein